jgi:Family of unknown function (DUF6165)
MLIEVSNGEIIDKLTILELKLKFIKDEKKVVNLKKEFKILQDAGALILDRGHQLFELLFLTNLQLWNIEDRCRELEALQQFDDEFIQVTRSVYRINDERAMIKKQINELTGSDLIEEKSYQ